MERRKHQVRVSTEGGGDNNPSSDGHSWRKYGQKEILGEKQLVFLFIPDPSQYLLTSFFFAKWIEIICFCYGF
jgi:hypothetical protein